MYQIIIMHYQASCGVKCSVFGAVAPQYPCYRLSTDAGDRGTDAAYPG